MKRIISSLLAVILLFMLMPMGIAESNYSYLDDMTIDELSALNEEVEKRIKQLKNAAEAAETPAEREATAENTNDGDEILEVGSRGDAVVALQKHLIALGYLTGSADGVYGQGTAGGVSKFQKAEGLTETGIADAETQRLLVELGAEALIYAEGKSAFEKLNATYDKVQKITWYEHKNQPKYTDICCYIYPYIGKIDDGEAWLRVQMNYTDAKTNDGWIFYDHATFCIDGENTVKYFSRNDIVRDNDTEVWELADFSPSEQEVELLREIAASSETIIRFEGDDYYYDHTVTAKEKTAIVDVLNAYDYIVR